MRCVYMGKPNAHSPDLVSLILIPSVKSSQEGAVVLRRHTTKECGGSQREPPRKWPKEELKCHVISTGLRRGACLNMCS